MVCCIVAPPGVYDYIVISYICFRAPALFSMITALWNPDVVQAKMSQDSQTVNMPVSESNLTMKMLSIITLQGDEDRPSMPGFAYSMQALHGEAQCQILQDTSPLYTAPSCLDLAQAELRSQTRFCCRVAVIHYKEVAKRFLDNFP